MGSTLNADKILHKIASYFSKNKFLIILFREVDEELGWNQNDRRLNFLQTDKTHGKE